MLKFDTDGNISDSMLCIPSLVNISIEFAHIWGSYGRKTSQKQPKMILNIEN